MKEKSIVRDSFAVAPAAPLPVPLILSRALEAAWAKKLLPEPALDPATMIEEAMCKEGGPLRDGAWRHALGILTHDLRESSALSALGRTIAYGQLVGILRQRIRATRLWEHRPEIFEHPVEAPVIILGHMRSGTTRLHRLLACDPRFSYTRLHETLRPLATRLPEAVISAAAVRGFLGLCNPRLRQIHPTSPCAAEEEFGLHAFSLHGAMFEAQWHVPRFARWSEQRPLDHVYPEFRRLVQTLRWRRREPRSRVQLLKAPQFMQDLDAMLSTFPDAQIILMQRDDRDVVASSASLVWQQQRVQSDSADPLQVGREWLAKTQLRQRRAEEALRHHRAVPVLQVDYAAMSADWRAEVRRIYDFLGLKLTSATLRRMERVASGSSHRGHVYTPEQFGIRPAALDEREPVRAEGRPSPRFVPGGDVSPPLLRL